MTTFLPPVREQRWILAIGAGLGVLFLVVPPINWLLQPLVTLFHELGHAVVFLIFGYPAIPSFDFLWGGGVTVPLAHFVWLTVLIQLALGGLVYRRWRLGRSDMGLCAGLFVLYALLAWTQGHLTLVSAAGHLATLTLAGIFLYRGLTARATSSEVEQTLYVASGLYVYFSEVAFAWALWTSKAARSDYRHSPKGINDLVVVARDLGLQLQAVGALHLFLCLITLLVLFLFLFLKHRGGSPPPVEKPVEKIPVADLPDVWPGDSRPGPTD